MAQYMISAIGVNAGAIGAKRAVFGSILEQRMKVRKDGWNVATSPRRDAPTLRRPNVATPQRCDVGSTNLKLFLDSSTDVWHITYFCFLIQYVLDIYLGWC